MNRPGPAPPAGAVGARAENAIAVTIGAAGAVALWVWLSGQIAGWLHRGCWPHVRAAAVIGIAAGLPAHLSDPRQAWPAAARAALPGPVLIYGCGSLLLGAALGGLWAAGRIRRLPPGGKRLGLRARRFGGLAAGRARQASGPGWGRERKAGSPAVRGTRWAGGARWAGASDLRPLRVRRGGHPAW